MPVRMIEAKPPSPFEPNRALAHAQEAARQAETDLEVRYATMLATVAVAERLDALIAILAEER